MSVAEPLRSKLYRYVVPSWSMQSTQGADVFLTPVLQERNRATSRRYLPHYLRLHAILFVLLVVVALSLGGPLEAVLGWAAPLLVDIAASLELGVVVILGSALAALAMPRRADRRD